MIPEAHVNEFKRITAPLVPPPAAQRIEPKVPVPDTAEPAVPVLNIWAVVAVVTSVLSVVIVFAEPSAFTL
ncbi:MAG: hypothetical protein IPG24_07535 [Leptospiraceae bacterium]|nr:hypothetical protein [Leptospiraceae bacterium]